MSGKNVLLDVNAPNSLPTVTVNFASTTISHVCTADFNNAAMSIKCFSFDLPSKFLLIFYNVSLIQCV